MPYPPINRLGVIGDRRTAALVAADGTVCWWCLPDYDGEPVLGALLDASAGGHFRVGPRTLELGRQNYFEHSAMLVTRWVGADGELELTDAMPAPQRERNERHERRRTILRRLRCVTGTVDCAVSLVLRPDFGGALPPQAQPEGYRFDWNRRSLRLWSSVGLSNEEEGVDSTFRLRKGDEALFVLSLDDDGEPWDADLRRAFAETLDYWQAWSARLTYQGERAAQVYRTGMLVHLLSFAPSGAPVAAPTASLPERIGGDGNYDYRFAWLRDAALSLSLMSELGVLDEARRFLDWAARLPAGDKMELKVVYRVDGSTELPLRQRDELNGYRDSRPVQFGNAATDMVELGSFGYLADCALTYLDQGGTWHRRYSRLIERIATFTAGHWQELDSGIWELDPRPFVVSRVMSWVTLDRACRIFERMGDDNAEPPRWRRTMAAIRREVLSRGWDERLGTFTQFYGSGTVDAALLLLPLLGFLPADDPRIEATIARIEATLMVNGFLHRFVERGSYDRGDQPVGENEGAFIMCTCWLAHWYVLRRELDKASAVLDRVERAAGEIFLLSEAIDSRTGMLLGNTPLLFSHVEYAKAAMALDRARRAEGKPA